MAELDAAPSALDEYQETLWNYMAEYKQKMHDLYSWADFMQTWDAKTCNYQRQRSEKSACYVPAAYEKCTSDDYVRRDELSIEELLKKEGVAGNDCLEEVRINIYSWAKAMGLLYELCMGEFDDYFVCKTPEFDFVIDLDEEGYYETLSSNKEQM
eukprot:UN10843